MTETLAGALSLALTQTLALSLSLPLSLTPPLSLSLPLSLPLSLSLSLSLPLSLRLSLTLPPGRGTTGAMTLNGIGELMTAAGLVVLLIGEHRELPALRATGKPLASLGFLIAAIGFGALDSSYGRIVFAGLALGALGDVFLLGRGRQFFIAGLVAFLLGHVAYVVAFASLGLDSGDALAMALVMAFVLYFIGRWIFPYAPEMRVPIAVYMVVIAAMCITAVGAAGAGAPSMIPVGAVMFTVSDIAVVRDRFISEAFVNRAWGLPLYYAAQLLIAWSIAAV